MKHKANTQTPSTRNNKSANPPAKTTTSPRHLGQTPETEEKAIKRGREGGGGKGDKGDVGGERAATFTGANLGRRSSFKDVPPQYYARVTVSR
eukprot:scaffold122431_cov30-Tisochrysis_lutea.AAC.2